MIGVPMPSPRDSIIANLNQQLEHYFGAGKSVQEIAQGVSGTKDGTFGTSHTNKLRAGRDKLAPELKALADSGSSLNKAAEALGIDHKRARLIARENGFKFKS
ncbi:hypothetical protein [Pseudomonas fluorescens]|uniref:hypothetical protein n=1 Tax=Pseudomonas fluorescens TaxID=294 RepID=UPI001240D0BB|nr:hypothetical protein [Pseudomonas fluorescens]VVN11017.1 hypothetical protein PS639_03788 [Pseudomonas fluorescens]